MTTVEDVINGAEWGVYQRPDGTWAAASSRAHKAALKQHPLDNYRSPRAVWAMFSAPCRCGGAGVVPDLDWTTACPGCAERAAIAALL